MTVRSLPRLLTLVAALSTLSCSLSMAGHAAYVPGTEAGLPGAPLPEGWTGSRQTSQTSFEAQPLFGVGPFEPPSASDCRGPQRLREVPGAASRQDAVLYGAGRRSPTAPTVAALTRSAAPAERDPVGEVRAEALADSRERRVAPANSAKPPPAMMAADQAQPTRVEEPPNREVVTAGMVDDNADFNEYLAFRQRHRHLDTRDRDVSERYRVEVRDSSGRPAADAEVALSWPGAARALRFARTDAAGQVWLHPKALVAPWQLGRLQQLEVQVRSGDDVVRTTLQRGQKSAVQVSLTGSMARPERTPLDLVFLVDATGSMGDEIAKLRGSLQTIANRVQGLPSRPDLCWGLVAYRDKGDAFITRSHDLTDDLGAFQGHLARLQAGGGGDYPEALNEALHETVHNIHWRGDGTARMVILVGDAPPHLDYGVPYYDQDSAAALARGIKVHSVGASGLDPKGEAVFRQIAQTTGGRFVFLTYDKARNPASGPGRETVHDVRNYSVNTLDDLIVRLVRDELAPAGGR